MFRIPKNSGPALPRTQRGAALMLVLVLVGMLVAMFAVVFVNDLMRQNQRQKATAQALALAKDALIGYAVSRRLDTAPPENRLGDLPCPDIDNDGEAGSSCSNGGGTTLGRLPWKSLGLADLRDGDGERLWYAVSGSFKADPPAACGSPGAAGCLNSDSRGTITVRNADAAISQNGTNPDPFTPSGAVAVVIAPGGTLQRQGAGSVQDRDPGNAAAINLASNYLDIGNGEDNANFTDSATDGFINGPIYAGDRLIVNDSVLSIKYEDVMPLMERRAAKEAMNCVVGYGAANNRYPWAAGITESGNVTGTAPYVSKPGDRFGRIPDTFPNLVLGTIQLTDPLLASTVALVCGLLPLCVSGPDWPASCTITKGTWWMHWKDRAFYATSAANQPALTVGLLPLTLSFPTAGACTAGNCMTVNPPSTAADKRVIVLLAGKQLAGVASGQPRSSAADKGNVANYLELSNAGNVPTASTGFTFQQGTAAANFNDTVLFQ